MLSLCVTSSARARSIEHRLDWETLLNVVSRVIVMLKKSPKAHCECTDEQSWVACACHCCCHGHLGCFGCQFIVHKAPVVAILRINLTTPNFCNCVCFVLLKKQMRSRCEEYFVCVAMLFYCPAVETYIYIPVRWGLCVYVVVYMDLSCSQSSFCG